MKVKMLTILKVTAIVGICMAATFVLLCSYLYFFDPFGNPTEKSLRAVESEVVKLGAKQFCRYGDNGKGLGSTIPWYQAYYSGAEDLEYKDKISDILEKNKFAITDDKEALSYSGRAAYDYGIGSPYEASEFITATGESTHVKVAIFRNMDVPIRCWGMEWGGKKSTNGGVIIHFSVGQ